MLLEVENLRVAYRKGKTTVEAVRGVSFCLDKGEALGIVGESGCGKSSMAKTIAGLQEASGGKISFEGGKAPDCRQLQMVFQDAAGSLNPRMTVRQTLEEALAVHKMCAKSERRERIARLLERTGLTERVLEMYPGEISGGQCQRAAIARCLALEPKILLADEPVSALDVSVQARILNLLQKLRKELGLAVLFISHDLAVVRTICDRVCVMQKGEFVEEGTVEDVLEHPKHPYTKSLLDAVPGV